MSFPRNMQKEVLHPMMRFEDFLAFKGFSPDEEQKEVIYSDVATVVSAGAGSGKTTVLSYRFLRLLMENKAHSDEILTLTFTNKAANEMYERIYNLLSEAALFDPMLSEELIRFSDSTISTLDSFSSQIARTSSLSYGVVKEFDIISDEDLRKMGKEVLENLFDEREELFSSLISYFSPNALYDNVFLPLMTKYSLFTAPDFCTKGKSYECIRERIYRDLKNLAYTLISDLEKFQKTEGNGIGNPLFMPGDSNLSVFVEKLDSDNYENLPKIDLRKGKGIKNIKDKLENLRSLMTYIGAFSARSGIDDDTLELFSLFFSLLGERKRSMGSFTYSDIADLALLILSENSDVRTFYKKKFRYIMIDEFQDNSPKQRDLLFILSEDEKIGGKGIPPLENLDRTKLFFVGDDKQSIYAFRGADVSVFNALKDDMERIGGRHIRMRKNYRSEKALIDHFNCVFSHVFSDSGKSDYEMRLSEEEIGSLKEEKGGDYHTKYEPALSREKGDIEPHIVLCYQEKPDASEGDEEREAIRENESEAEFISSLIQNEIVGKLMVRRKGEKNPSPATYDDVAILFSTGNIQIPLEKVFRRDGIPYFVSQNKSVTSEAMTNDFLSLFRLALFPGDKISFLSVLRSPFVRLSDEDFLLYSEYRELYEYSEDDFFIPDSMSDEGKAKIERFSAFFSTFLSMMGRREITELVDYIYYDGGYSAYLAQDDSLSSYTEHYECLWAIAERSKSLISFINYLEENLGSGRGDDGSVILRMEESGVEMMTIHKSKGLEFPIVILAGASSTGKPSDVRISISPDLDFMYLGDRMVDRFLSFPEKLRLLEEKKRLLYVALTRAIDHLFIVGTASRKRDKKDECYGEMNKLFRNGSLAMTYLDALSSAGLPSDVTFMQFPYLEERSDSDFVHIGKLSSSFYESGRDEIKPKEGIKGLKERGHEEGLVFNKDAMPLPPLAEDADDIISRHDAASDAGTYFHSIFESFFTGKNISESSLQFLSASELAQLRKAGKRIIGDFESSSLYNKYIKGKDVRTEELLYVFSDDEAFPAVVDLLVFSDDFNLVVDYKSDKMLSPEIHKNQVVGYVRALEDVYRKKCYGTLYYMRDKDAVTPFWDKDGNTVSPEP